MIGYTMFTESREEVGVTMTTVDRWSGREARALREARRMSLRQFAQHLGVSDRMVSKWEAGGDNICPRPMNQAVLDTSLAQCTPEEQVRFRLIRSVATASTVRVASAEELAQMHAEKGPPSAAFTCSFSYGSLLARGIAAWPGLSPDEAQRVVSAMADARRYLDDTVIDHFHRQLTACKVDDGTLGPTAPLPVVLGILGAVEEHARTVTHSVRRSLLTVGAEAAEFAAWLFRDSHEPVAASFWHDRAIEWAQEAGDMPMQGYVLLRKSQMAYEERDGLRVLSFAQAAQYGPWQLPPKIRAEVTQQEARGMAMAGEPFNAIEHKLDEASRLADTADDADSHAHFGACYNDGTHLLRAASCYMEAGKPAKSAALFGAVLEAGELSRRDEGYFRARRAAALALSGEPDDAAHEGLAAVELAAALRSSRTRRELLRVSEILAPWSSRPEVRTLRAALTT